MYKVVEIGQKHTFSSSFILGLLLNVTLPPFEVWILLPCFFSLFLFMVEGIKTQKKAFWAGFFFYFGYFFGGLYWIGISLSVDWEKFFWILPFSCLGIPAILSLMMAPSFYGFWAVGRTPFTKVMVFISITLILELIRTYVFPQFPWNLLGSTLAGSAWFLQSTAVFGIFGLTVAASLFGALPYLLIKLKSRVIGITLCIFLMGIACAGGIRLSFHPSTFDQKISLRLIQPNIPQTLKWDNRYRVDILNKLIDLSTPSSDEISPLLTIWPESAIPFFINEEPLLRHHITTLICPQGFLITGGGRRIVSPNPEKPSSNIVTQVWNSLFVLDGQSEILSVYDKNHLVPFGEYIPLRSLMGTLPFSKITHGTLDFSKGESLKTIAIPSIPPFSPLICYEIAFPHQIVNLYEQRPNWILNITNDAWFGTSTGPYQHLQMAQIRATEEGLPIIRVANTGISAVIDPYGRIVKYLPLNQTGTIDTYLPTSLNSTIYATYGNWTALITVVLIWLFIGGIYSARVRLKKE